MTDNSSAVMDIIC